MTAQRKLILNGLTATCAGDARVPADTDGDFYHELEIFMQLVKEQQTPLPNKASSPNPVPDGEKTKVKAETKPSSHASMFRTCCRLANYMGSFPVAGGENASKAEYVSEQLQKMKESGKAIPVLVVVSLAGVKICRPEDKTVRMAHALRRISYATCEPARALFGFVAREPKGSPTKQYCHSFTTQTASQAEELNSLVGDAFRMAFATQLQPAASVWSKKLSSSGSEQGTMGVRAPTSIPGLTHRYPGSPCHNRSPAKCELIEMKLKSEQVSPSGSEESNSPTELNCYRRLADKPPLMKRLAMGLSGALMPPPDDEVTPLVADTPTSPTNRPICLNGGYINEAVSENDVRATKESNREDNHSALTPTHIHVDSKDNNSITNNFDCYKKQNNMKNSIQSLPVRTSRGSSSSGGSTCSGSCTNNNLQPRQHLEPDLRNAPWFQAGIPREIALEVLNNQPVGAFMVRCSTTQTGCYALSVRVPRDFQPTGIAHYLILRTTKGYKIKGFTKEFRTLSALVTHHSVMPELLPCPLWLARYNPGYARAEQRHPDDLADPHYSAFSDFRQMMCELDLG